MDPAKLVNTLNLVETLHEHNSCIAQSDISLRNLKRT